MWIRYFSVFCLFFSWVAPLAAKADPQSHPNELCASRGVQSFRLMDGFDDFPLEKVYPGSIDVYFYTTTKYRGLDVCLLREDHVPEPIQKLISHLGEINSQIRSTFGNDFFTYVLPEGLKIEFSPSDRGFDYSRHGKIVRLKAFRDWTGESIDDSGYVRELGHFLMEVPALAGWSSPLILEGVPDLLALLIAGDSSQQEGLPGCFAKNKRGPFSPGGVGFQSSGRFFVQHALERQLFSECCKDFEQIKPELDPRVQRHWVTACRSMQIELLGYDFSDRASGRVELPETSFSPAQCFRPENGLLIDRNCDRHALGAVFSHFLYDLNRQVTSRSVAKLIVRFLVFLGHHPIRGSEFSCSLTRFRHQYAVRVQTQAEVQALFHLLKSNIDPLDVIRFDALWQSYGMELGVDLDQLFIQNQLAADAAGYRIFQEIKGDPIFWIQNRPCGSFKEYSLEAFAQVPGCEVVCRPVR